MNRWIWYHGRSTTNESHRLGEQKSSPSWWSSLGLKPAASAQPQPCPSGESPSAEGSAVRYPVPSGHRKLLLQPTAFKFAALTHPAPHCRCYATPPTNDAVRATRTHVHWARRNTRRFAYLRPKTALRLRIRYTDKRIGRIIRQKYKQGFEKKGLPKSCKPIEPIKLTISTRKIKH